MLISKSQCTVEKLHKQIHSGKKQHKAAAPSIFVCVLFIFTFILGKPARYTSCFASGPLHISSSHLRTTHISSQPWDSDTQPSNHNLKSVTSPSSTQQRDDSLDQVYPVVDGGPVEKGYIFFVWLPNVEARLHQLPAALEDAVPEERGQSQIHVQTQINTGLKVRQATSIITFENNVNEVI